MQRQQSHERKKEIVKVTLVGTLANFFLLAFKFAAGILGRSGAMIADAVHSLSDFTTDIVVLLFVNISAKPKDDTHDYGHGKYETLATSVIGIVLFFVGAGLMWDGAKKIYGHYFLDLELESPGTIALVAALVSIAVKEALYRYTATVGRRENSPAVTANAWHHRSDAFSSIGTALGIGGAILLGPSWRILDPLAAILVSVLIVKVAFSLVKPAVDELLEKSLPKDTEDEIISLIMDTPGVSDPHNLCTRRIGNSIAIEVHIRVDAAATVSYAHELTKTIEKRLRGRFGQDTHINLHVEPIESGVFGPCARKN